MVHFSFQAGAIAEPAEKSVVWIAAAFTKGRRSVQYTRSSLYPKAHVSGYKADCHSFCSFENPPFVIVAMMAKQKTGCSPFYTTNAPFFTLSVIQFNLPPVSSVSSPKAP
jgi:hypothetical protein